MAGVCRCMILSFCCLAISFLVSFVFGLFCGWINIHTVKAGATCYIQNFYVPALNNTAGNYTTGNSTSINFAMNCANSHEYMGIYYDGLNLTFYYGSNRSLSIGSYVEGGFHQGSEDNAYWSDLETTQGIPWDTVRKNCSAVDIRVDLATMVRYNQMFLKGKPRRLRVGVVVQVNDTTGLKVKKKSIKLKSGASELIRSGAPMILLAGTLMFLV